MKTVGQVVSAKADVGVHTIVETASVLEVLRVLAEETLIQHLEQYIRGE